MHTFSTLTSPIFQYEGPSQILKTTVHQKAVWHRQLGRQRPVGSVRASPHPSPWGRSVVSSVWPTFQQPWPSLWLRVCSTPGCGLVSGAGVLMAAYGPRELAGFERYVVGCGWGWPPDGSRSSSGSGCTVGCPSGRPERVWSSGERGSSLVEQACLSGHRGRMASSSASSSGSLLAVAANTTMKTILKKI